MSKAKKNKIYSFFKSSKYSFKFSLEASKKYFFIRMFLQIVQAFFPIIFAFTSKVVINKLNQGILFSYTRETFHSFILICVVIFSVSILQSIILRLDQYYSDIHRELLIKYINLLISEKTSSMDIKYFDDPKTYDELTNIKRDSYGLHLLVWNAFNLTKSTVQFIACFSVLFSYNYLWAFILTIVFIPAAYINRKYQIYSYKQLRNTIQWQRKMNYATEIMSGREYAKDIRFYNYYKYIKNKYISIWDNWYELKRKLLRDKTVFSSLADLMPALGLLGFSIFVGFNILVERLTIGDYGLYIGISNQLSNSIASIINSYTDMYENELQISFFIEFLDWENSSKDKSSIQLKEFQSLEFRNVSFKYPHMDIYSLKDVSFIFNKGDKIAIVGVNGAGKTTIIKLLLRFYPPNIGNIYLNGMDINHYEITEYRKLFSVMFQDFVRYAFTIEENIYLSKIENQNDIDRIKTACDKSGISQILEKHKVNLNNYLSRRFDENGLELSMGEWQKIALGRVFFRECEILILDEPSSSLDAEAEHEIFKQFDNFWSNKSSIYVSHRLKNVIKANKIIVMEKGSIIEEGTHKELVKLNGRYAYLFKMQASEYVNQEYD